MDEADSVYPFSKKLAKENKWTHTYTQLAIEEYKKFVFLGVVADHTVSPSDIIDRVWHLHLIYTQSYWQDFCPNVLGKPFHHNPSRGGRLEKEKYTELYQKTLISYQAFFGEKPPSNIWAEPNIGTVKKDYIELLKGFFNPTLKMISSLLMLSFLLVGCQPLDGFLKISGPDFLNLYFCLGVFAFMWQRWFLRNLPKNYSETIPELDLYQTAYLVGSQKRTIDVAIVSLVEKDNLKVSAIQNGL